VGLVAYKFNDYNIGPNSQFVNSEFE